MESKRDKLTEVLERLLLIAKAKKDPWTFISKYVYTLDKPKVGQEAIKLFPSESRKDKKNYRYLRFLTRIFQRHDKILVPKSRQILITWLFVALSLWYALNNEGATIAMQKLTFEDANQELVERAKFIFDRLPTEMKPKNVRSVYGVLEFPDLHSKLIAIAQGKEQIRGKTIAIVLSDEMAFQDQSAEAYFAARPSVEGGGKYLGVSTPNGEDFFYHLVHDLEAQWKDV